MTTIRLLANVADDPKGAVLTVGEDRAKRLIRTGYAELVTVDVKPAKQRTKDKTEGA
jgi:hypothetical protein